MVKASELLGIGSNGGGSVNIEGTVAVGSAIVSGQGVSLDSNGNFIPYDGSRRLIGTVNVSTGSGAAASILTLGRYAGTVIEYENASDLGNILNSLDVSTMVIDSGNITPNLGFISNSIVISEDGTKIMYAEGQTLGQRTMSTPFRLDTVGSVTAFSFTPQDSDMASFDISRDGKKMYALGNTTKTIYEYTLGTPNEISTAALTSQVSIGGPNNWEGLSVSDDGEYIIAGDLNGIIKSYKMSTLFDITTAVLDSQITVGSTYTSIKISSTGKKLYTVSTAGANSVREYDIATAFDLTTLNTTPVSTISFGSNNLGLAYTTAANFAVVSTTGNFAQAYTATPIVDTVTPEIGEYLYLTAAGKPTPNPTDNFVGLRISPTKVILTQPQTT